jgi:hypothetical protein
LLDDDVGGEDDRLSSSESKSSNISGGELFVENEGLSLANEGLGAKW